MYVKLVFKFLQKDVSLSIDLWRHKFLGKILLSAYLGWNTFGMKKEYRKNEIFDCSFTVVQMILNACLFECLHITQIKYF